MSATTHEFVVFGQVVYACFALRTTVALVMLEYRDWFNFGQCRIATFCYCWSARYCCTAAAETLLVLLLPHAYHCYCSNIVIAGILTLVEYCHCCRIAMIAILLPVQHWWGYRTATTAALLLPQSCYCCKTVTAVTWQLQQYCYCRDAQAKAVVLVLRCCYR